MTTVCLASKVSRLVSPSANLLAIYGRGDEDGDHYRAPNPIRRPLAAAFAGAAVAILGGLIGLGGAEFRLPIPIGVFALFPHRAVRTNLLISLATLGMSAVAD